MKKEIMWVNEKDKIIMQNAEEKNCTHKKKHKRTIHFTVSNKNVF
jgi:hypothetical protein